ncbi:MAG: LptF/LptG family permease, partial [Kiritimatiellaeota bacterium]|nr:LptF/LptG family permease [Kiritimatiellota bacterium]
NYVYRNPAARREWRVATLDLASEATVSTVTGAVTIVQEQESGERLWRMEARQALYRDGAWWMASPVFHAYDDEERDHRVGEGSAPLSLVRIPELTETPRDILVASRELEHCSLRDMRRRVTHHGEDRPAMHFAIANRMAMPWSCVVLVLFAIPTGLTTARQSIVKGLFFALAAFVGFYVISQFGVFLGSKGYVPPAMAAWAPNAVWLILASALYRKLR